MSIKVQLNSTFITVFIISIYVTHVKFYGLVDQRFNPLVEARNFSHPKTVQMGSQSTQTSIGAISPGVKCLENKTGHTLHLLQRLRSPFSHISQSCAGTALPFMFHNAPKQGGGWVIYPSLFACIL
jgi:hypothetical protein